MYTASIYFMGQYRPAYFQAETKHAAIDAALAAVAKCHDFLWFSNRLAEALIQLKGNCTAYSTDHGCRGIALRTGPHDPFLDGMTSSFPHYPDLDYSGAANA